MQVLARFRMHIRFKRKSSSPAPESLSAQVETIRLHESMESFLDVEDEDVLTYVDNLLRTCKEIGPLEPFSLMSREEALQAIESKSSLRRLGMTMRTVRRVARRGTANCGSPASSQMKHSSWPRTAGSSRATSTSSRRWVRFPATPSLRANST
jgi:hypothetical protein